MEKEIEKTKPILEKIKRHIEYQETIEILEKYIQHLEQKETILNRVTDILKEDIDKYNKELLKDSIMSIKNTDLTARILQSQKILNIIEGENKQTEQY